VTFAVRRLGLGALVVVAVSFLSWLIFVPALKPLFGFFAEPNPSNPVEMAKRAHLGDPILVRYGLWAKGLFTGQGFGRTVVDQAPIGTELRSAVEHTGELISLSLVIIVIASVLIAGVEARRRDSSLDVGLRATSYLVWSVPTFLLALLLIHAVAAAPASWHLSGFVQGGPPTGAGDFFQRLTLPVLTLAVGYVGLYSRYLRSSLLVSLNEPYAWVARGKGLSEPQVVRRHAFRNALVPFTTVMALDFGAVFGASIAVDYIFNLGGLASLILHGLSIADPFLIEAGLVVTAASVVVAGIVGDLVCGWLDPRIRLA
jgi:peptide/nickel transport system permease protein